MVLTKCGNAHTIKSWFEHMPAEDGSGKLFLNVFPQSNGEIEFWVTQKKKEEARVRLATVLVEIATLSGVDLINDPVKAKAYFKNPANVWHELEMNVSGLTLTDQKKALSEFSMGILATTTRRPTQQGRFMRNPPKKRLQLVFNTVEPVSAGPRTATPMANLHSKNRARRAKQSALRYDAEQEVTAANKVSQDSQLETSETSLTASMIPPSTNNNNETVGVAWTNPLSSDEAEIATLAHRMTPDPPAAVLPHGVKPDSERARRIESFRDIAKRSSYRTNVAMLTQLYKKTPGTVEARSFLPRADSDMVIDDVQENTSASVLHEADTITAGKPPLAVVAETAASDLDDGMDASDSSTWTGVPGRRTRANRRNSKMGSSEMLEVDSIQEDNRVTTSKRPPPAGGAGSTGDAKSISSAEAAVLRRTIESLSISGSRYQQESSAHKAQLRQLYDENAELREVQATFEAASKAQAASYLAANKIQAERLERLEEAVSRLSAPASGSPRRAAGRGTGAQFTPPRLPSSSNSGRGDTKKKRVYSPPSDNKFAALADDSADDEEENGSSPIASMCDLSNAEDYETGMESMIEDNESVVSELSIVLETQSPNSSVGDTPGIGSNDAGMPV